MAKLLISLFLFAAVSCTNKFQPNKIHYTFSKKVVENTLIHPQFGFYSIQGYFLQKKNYVNYILFNNNRLLFFTDTSQTIIYTQNKTQEQVFSITSSESGVYKLAASGQLYHLENNQFFPLVNLNKLTMMKKENMIVSPYYKSQNYFHLYNNQVLFPIISKRDIYTSNPMFASYNLRTKQLKLLPLKTDATFIKYQFGSNNIFLSQMKGDTLIVHYPYSQVLTLFSLKKNKIISQINPFYNQADKQPEVFSEVEDPSAFYRYNLESPTFGSLIYNPHKKHYYRFYRLALDRKNEKDEFTIEEDKKNTILIYNKNFTYLGQIFLPKKFYLLNEITPSKTGFVLSTNFNVKKNKLEFYEINYH